MSDRKREIARRIRNLRRERKMTQDQVAASMHMSRHTILDIEWGRRSVLLDEAVQFAILFDVELTYLAGTTNGYRKVGA